MKDRGKAKRRCLGKHNYENESEVEDEKKKVGDGSAFMCWHHFQNSLQGLYDQDTAGDFWSRQGNSTYRVGLVAPQTITALYGIEHASAEQITSSIW